MANGTNQKSDAIVRRLYARGNWKLRSVAHFGGDETGIADMCLLQDSDGNPFIPGTSITGAVRSFLAKRLLPWTQYSDPKGIDKESPELKQFFGGAGKNDTMSALIVADGIYASEKVITSIRDGVRIEAESGIAADKAKFDVEVVERGTEFTLEFVCIIREGDCQSEYEKLFLALLHGFEKEGIRLGARTRRGYGRGRVDNWDIRDLKMDNCEHVMVWLNGDIWNSNQGKSKLSPDPLLTDQRRFFRIEANFELRTSLLIRSSSEDPNKKDEVPDTTHLHSKDEPVIPGTSFAGAFRHRANLIADILKWQTHGNGQDAVSEMFGAVHKQDNDGSDSNQTDPWASRVFIEERVVENVKPQWQDRVAIDRFTGGSLQSALFNEKPVYPCPIKTETQTNIRLRLTLEEPKKAEIGLLLLTLRDFWSGHAVLGGETSNGRGTLQGIKAKLIYKDNPDPTKTEEWKLEGKHMTVKSDDDRFLQSCVDAAKNYKDCPKASRRPKEDVKEDSDAE